jgi:hypothetical protein
VPPPEIRCLRDLTRLRKAQINERSRAIQRLEKVLQDAGTRHDILVAYYHIVRDEAPFRELGPDWQRRRYSPEHRARRLQRQLEALGYKVTPEQDERAEQAA